MRDIVTKHHPEFRNNIKLRTMALEHPDFFNIEKLVEHTLAEVGPYEFIDGDHCDYDDGTDCKTASIRVNPSKDGSLTHRGEISGVTSVSGSMKIGGLRCIIYNPHSDGLKYYFLPRKFWQENITFHPTSGIGKIVYSYNRKTRQIPKFVGYECASFEELAHKKDYSESFSDLFEFKMPDKD